MYTQQAITCRVVIAGLDPAIQSIFSDQVSFQMDRRVKPGDDE